MVIILSFIAINLVEKIEINLIIPDYIVKLLSSKRSDLFSFFLSGVLATLLATPCTAPFITIAVGFALTTELNKMLIIFTLMGIGMAMPYIALAIFPKIEKIFPKPGEWMIKFKKFLGVIIFVTSLWLIYIVSTQLGYKAGITLFMLVILMKFVLIEQGIFSNKLKLWLILLLIMLCYFIPKHLYEEKQQEEVMVEELWREYKPEQIYSLIDKNHIVLLDVTASWCATCNVNKLTTLNNSIIMSFMKKHNIIGMRADISKENTPQVSTLMKMHNHYGIPLNIIYSKKFPQGIKLPSFLTPNILIEAIKKAGL